MWKEYRENFAKIGLRSAISLIVVPILLLGVFLPWQMGTAWFTSPITMLMWAWLPAFMVISVVADSFAGERERHTIETLLASRLPDRAILLGKISVVVLYSWGTTLAGMATALITINVLYGNGSLLMYSADTVLIGVTFSLLVATLVTTGGCLVSLRAATVRQAQQTISTLFMIPLFGLVLGGQLLPKEWITSASAFTGNLSIVGLLGLAEVLILLVDAGLIGTAMARFKRAKLSMG